MIGALRTWWDARETRERLLILLAGILSGAIIAWQFIFLPSAKFRSDQERAFSAALGEYVYVTSVTQTMTASQARPSRGQPLQAVLTNTSDLYGLTISRLLPADDEGLNVWIDTAPAQLLYAWIGDLEREHGVRVERAAIRRNQAGDGVNANLFLRRQD
jgi:general secretion pathway protein M